MARLLAHGFLAVILAALSLTGSSTAHAQTSCLPGLQVPGSAGTLTTATGGGGETIAHPNSPIAIGPSDCEFYPGAYTTLWTPTGQTSAILNTTSPGPGISQVHSIQTTQGGVTKSGSINIVGARAGAPICTLAITSPAPALGTDVTVKATCAPAAFAYTWDAFNATLLSGQNTDTAVFRVDATAPANRATLYMHAVASGQFGPHVAVLVGDAPAPPPPPPPPEIGLLPQARVSAGSFHACARNETGAAFCWGRNDEGQLGNGTNASSNAPVAVSGLASGVLSISAGNLHTCAVTSDRTVQCWGGGVSNVPSPLPGVSNVLQVSSGYDHTCALTSAGGVFCWGGNQDGQLGNGTNTASGGPVPVTGLSSGVMAISASTFSTCALTNTGRVKCWGNNQFGQLGNGTQAASNVPVDVSGLATGVTHIAANRGHACAVKAGAAVCWGENASGQLGNGTTAPSTTPVAVSGLTTGIGSVIAGYTHNCALALNGALRCWGSNAKGELGDGTDVTHLTPVSVSGLGAGVVGATAHFQLSCAESSSGAVDCWGDNSRGQLGDGTLATARRVPQKVVGVGGNALLDLSPSTPLPPPPNAPSFPMVVSGSVTASSASATATIPVPPAGNRTFVFAYAAASVVKDAQRGYVAEAPMGAKAGGKATAVQCVLAQLSASGQLVGASASNLQAYVGAVVNGQSQSVTILNGVPTVQIGGATFYVGYGTSSDAMFANGTSRSAVQVPGDLRCDPQAPQKGWWWNPAEDGRGYSIEVAGNRIFFASFLYDASGRSTWYVATGTTSLDGSLFQGDLLAASNGQQLGGAYPGKPTLTNSGRITLAFSDATRGTIVWPGGTVPIQRLPFVPNGLSLAPLARQPEAGWWWNEAESGRGFFLEWQGDQLDIAGYMYDEAGQPVWFLTVGRMSPDGATFNANWWRFANGMTLAGPWKPHTRVSDTVAPVTITFSGPDTALMTLPNNRTTTLKRHRF